MRFTYLPCRSATLAFAVSLAGVLVLAFGTSARAQQPIQIFLSAVDADEKPVVDLKEEEIDIQVDGAACPIARFEAINWPTKLTVMVDNSPVFNDSLRQLRESLRAFFNAISADAWRCRSSARRRRRGSSTRPATIA